MTVPFDLFAAFIGDVALQEKKDCTHPNPNLLRHYVFYKPIYSNNPISLIVYWEDSTLISVPIEDKFI